MFRKRKFFSACIAAILTISLLPISAFAVPTAGDTWEDYAAADFAGGSGTAGDPYQIETPEQLAKLAKDINSGVLDTVQGLRGKHFEMTASIDLSAHRWVPIGKGPSHSSHQSFEGYFNGNGKTISGLRVDETGTGYVAGLFGHISSVPQQSAQAAAVRDLTIRDAVVKSSNRIAQATQGVTIDEGWAGILSGAVTNEGVRISNCTVSGEVSSQSRTGGLVGYASYTAFDQCAADVTIRGNGVAGGFIGEAYKADFENCTSMGSVNGGYSVGGFAGILFTDTELEKCISKASVHASDWNAGGFAGYIEKNVTIKNSAAYGDVVSTLTANQPKAGGFVGTNHSSTIANSFALGKVTEQSAAYSAGGFIGYDLAGTTQNSFFDTAKNPTLQGVGEVETAGTHQITGSETSDVLKQLCEQLLGGHHYVDGTCTECGLRDPDAPVKPPKPSGGAYWADRDEEETPSKRPQSSKPESAGRPSPSDKPEEVNVPTAAPKPASGTTGRPSGTAQLADNSVKNPQSSKEDASASTPSKPPKTESSEASKAPSSSAPETSSAPVDAETSAEQAEGKNSLPVALLGIAAAAVLGIVLYLRKKRAS